MADGQIYVCNPVPSLHCTRYLQTWPKSRFEMLLLSFGVWQGMLDPYTPLGQDIFSHLISGMGKLFNVNVKPEEQRVLFTAGDRLFVNITGLVRNPIGRKVLNVFVSALDPVSGNIVKGLLTDPRFAETGNFKLRNALRLIRGILSFCEEHCS